MRSIPNIWPAVFAVCLPLSAMSMDGPKPVVHGSTPVAPVSTTVAGAPVAASAAVASATSTYVDGMGRSVKASDLAGFSGGTAITNKMSLNGTVSNNSDTNVSTGMNSIGGGSFADSAGIPMVIQNSGNNVLIQNATIINVQFKP